jgi:hypothetical protein
MIEGNTYRPTAERYLWCPALGWAGPSAIMHTSGHLNTGSNIEKLIRGHTDPQTGKDITDYFRKRGTLADAVMSN